MPKQREKEEAGEEEVKRQRLTARRKAEILAAVAAAHGGVLRPVDVVAEADPGNGGGIAHELAGLVGWELSEREAADRYRQDAARALIRSVEPELIQLGVVELKAPYYVHDPRQGSAQGYTRLLALKSSEEVALDALRAERDRAVAALERVYSMAAALGMETEAAEAVAALGALGRAPAVPPGAGEGAALARS